MNGLKNGIKRANGSSSKRGPVTAITLSDNVGVQKLIGAISQQLEYAHNGDGTRALTADLAA